MTVVTYYGPLTPAPDRFRAGTAPLSEILEYHSIYSLPGEDQTLEAALYYDDWYLYQIPQGTWGLYKMREREHDGGDSDTPGMTVSFVPFDVDLLKTAIRKTTPENLKRLAREIHRVTAAPGQRHSDEIRDYFLKPEADGPYLMGCLYINKLADLAPEGVLPLPEKLSPRLRRFLEQDPGFRGDRLIVKEASPEAILACHSGNVSLHSLAAEIRFHAAFLKSRLPGVYASALRADMGVLKREFPPVMPYYNENSRWVTEQAQAHPRLDIRISFYLPRR